jgi:hypothetical protein
MEPTGAFPDSLLSLLYNSKNGRYSTASVKLSIDGAVFRIGHPMIIDQCNLFYIPLFSIILLRLPVYEKESIGVAKNHKH